MANHIEMKMEAIDSSENWSHLKAATIFSVMNLGFPELPLTINNNTFKVYDKSERTATHNTSIYSTTEKCANPYPGNSFLYSTNNIYHIEYPLCMAVNPFNIFILTTCQSSRTHSYLNESRRCFRLFVTCPLHCATYHIHKNSNLTTLIIHIWSLRPFHTFTHTYTHTIGTKYKVKEQWRGFKVI